MRLSVMWQIPYPGITKYQLLRRLRQEDHKFEARLGSLKRFCLKIK
jgi:hypothetical protein